MLQLNTPISIISLDVKFSCRVCIPPRTKTNLEYVRHQPNSCCMEYEQTYFLKITCILIIAPCQIINVSNEWVALMDSAELTLRQLHRNIKARHSCVHVFLCGKVSSLLAAHPVLEAVM